MPVTTIWEADFDDDAVVAKFFHTPIGGLCTAAPVRKATYDGVPCIELVIGDEVPGFQYFGAKVSGDWVDGYDQMIADAAGHSNGAVAHCYSYDNSKHGRYVHNGTVWGSRTGPITAPLADDLNHQGVVAVQLALQSWSAAADPFAYNDGTGGVIDKLGFPDIRDLDGLELVWPARVIGGSIGERTKIFPHVQTRIDAPSVGSNDDVPFVNSFYAGPCVSDYFFGGTGPFSRNTQLYCADSGWTDCYTPLNARFSEWVAMGGNDFGTQSDKVGRLPFSQPQRYVCASPEVWLRNWTGASYMLIGKVNPNPGTPMAGIPQNECFRGTLLFGAPRLIQRT
jgi:hypothetical protein